MHAYSQEEIAHLNIEAGNYRKEEDYWLEVFPEEFGKTIIPRDDLGVESSGFCRIEVELDEEMYDLLRTLSRDNDQRAYVVLATAVLILVRKMAATPDVCIGMPALKYAGEGQPLSEYLALRVQVDGQLPVKKLLNEVKAGFLAAHENQNYPLGLLELDRRRNGEAFSLFDIYVVFRNIHPAGYDPETFGPNVFFDFREEHNRLYFTLVYNSALYSARRAGSVAKHFLQVLSIVTRDLLIAVGDLEIIAPDEKRTLFGTFNHTFAPIRRDKLFIDYFQEQVAAAPGAVAAIHNGEQITYGDLNRRVNQLAHYLREKGLTPNQVAIVWCDRSIDFLVGVLGILKTGGAFLAINQEEPFSRAAAVICNSGARMLLTRAAAAPDWEGHLRDLAGHTALNQVICLDELPDPEKLSRVLATCRLARELTREPVPYLSEPFSLQYGPVQCSPERLRAGVDHLCAFIRREHLDAGSVGLVLTNPVLQITAALALARLGLLARWLEAGGGEDGLRTWVYGTNVSLLLAESSFADEADRVFWQVPGLKHLLLLDYDKAHEANYTEGYKDVFDSLARKEDLQVNDFGWFNSFDGSPFTPEEMAEYIDNCRAKLGPFVGPDCKVLEIGCGHGLVYKALVGQVKYYLATDPSPAIIARNRDYAAGQGLTNIDFQVLYGNQIGAADRRDFDVVVCSSVTDYFPNTLYFEEVIVQAISVLNDTGVIYMDDMLNLDKRDAFIRETRYYMEKNPGGRTKTNWESDLFIHADFFRFLQAKYSAIAAVECSPKRGTIDNELNRYRFDVMLRIDKRNARPAAEPFGKRRFCLSGLPVPHGEAGSAGAQDSASARLAAVADCRSYGNRPAENPNVQVVPDDLCYLIYSSGTTGSPKGIMLHHLGMVNHFVGMIGAMGLNAGTCFAQTASCNFDIFVMQLLMPLMAGGRLVIADKALLLEAGRLFDAIEAHQITVVELVPSVIAVLLDKLEEEPLQQLPSLQYLISCGEQLTANLAGRWYQRLPGTTLLNAYGPAEASDDVTIQVVDREALPGAAVVPIGKPLPNVHIYILDQDHQLCPFGVIGEIAIAGISVGKGYWNDPQKTEKAFIPNHLVGPEAGPDYGVIYKTGDLGYWHENGYVVWVGRRDFMVKIRGIRIELEEIEKVLLGFPGVGEAVVVPYLNGGEKVLCAYFTRHYPLDAAALRDYLGKKLPAYMIPSYLLPLDEIPTTRNGKTDRQLLQGRVPWADAAGPALTHPVAVRLAAIWAEILGVKPEVIGMASDFFNLGGHSLKAVKLVAHVHKHFDVKVPLETVFADATLGGVTAAILAARQEVFKSIPVAAAMPAYALSPPQRRFYVHNQLFPDDISYNTPQFYHVTGNLDPARVEAVFRRLIERHASLRTAFRMVDNEPRQVIAPVVPFALEVIRTDGQVPDGFINGFVRPFDLSVAPLLRVSLMQLAAQRFVLAIDIHHIVSDEISDNLLMEDFVALYAGNEPAAPALEYKDYAEWYNDCLQGGRLREQEAYWLNVFSELPPRLGLPYDRGDEGINHFVGDDLTVTLRAGALEHAALVMKEIAATPFAFFLAAFNVLLARLTGREDIVVGTPVSGRDHAELDGVIGLFLNQLALRNHPAPEKSFRRFLAEVKEGCAKAVQAQMYPFDTLTGRLGLQGNLGENPLYEVMFAHLQKRPGVLVVDGVEFSAYSTEHHTAKADLQLTVFEGSAEVDLVLTYSGRFTRRTAERLLAALLEIVQQVTANPDLPLGAVEVSHSLATAASASNAGRLNLDFH